MRPQAESEAAQNWYAHVPGIKVLTPATVPDAYAMVLAALADLDPVFIFEKLFEKLAPLGAACF